MTTTSMEELPSLKGQELGSSPWFEVTQDRVQTFAEATEDRQWIHLDVERAKRESPFGGPVAHGYLTLSLLIPLWSHVLTVVDASAVVNYGLNKVRFLSAVTAGSRIRVRSELADATKVADDTVNLTVRHTVEIDGVDKPAAVAELIARFVW